MPKRRCWEREGLCTLGVQVREPKVSPRPLIIGALTAGSQRGLPQKRYPVGRTTVVPQSTPWGGRYPRGLPPPAGPPQVKWDLFGPPFPCGRGVARLETAFRVYQRSFALFLGKSHFPGWSLPCLSHVATVVPR